MKVLAILAALLAFHATASAAQTTCSPGASIGVVVPQAKDAVCLMALGSNGALVILLDEGLIVVAPGVPVQQYQGGRTGLSVMDVPAQIVFCPAGVALDRSSCLADPYQMKAGIQAFSGRAQLQAGILTDKASQSACPASLHIEGTVSSPAREPFHLSASLVTFTSAEGGCEVMQHEAKLTYDPLKSLQSGTGNGTSGGNGIVSQAAAVPAASPSANGNSGNPTLQQQLDTIQAMIAGMGTRVNDVQSRVYDVQVRQAEVRSQTATDPFDFDANWCFEFALVSEFGIDTKTKTEVSAKGQGGADVFGNAATAKLEAKQEGSAEFSMKGEIDAPKLSVCMKGPIIKALTEPFPEPPAEAAGDANPMRTSLTSSAPLQGPLAEMFAELQAKLPVLKERLPVLTNRFGLQGQRLEKAANLFSQLDGDFLEPGSLAGSGRAVLSDVIEALPMSPEMRTRLHDALGMLDNLSEKLKICKQVNAGTFPPRLTSTLSGLCANVDGENLRNAIETIQNLVESIKSRLPGQGSSVFN